MHFPTIVLCIFSFAHAAPSLYAPMRGETGELAVPSSAVLAAALAQDSKLGELIKRQEDFTRTLEADYYFECPHAGKKSRVFQWRAVFKHEHSQIILEPVKNINKIGATHTSGNQFAAKWQGYLCLPVGDKECSYIWQGKTTGYVDHVGIGMILVLESTDVTDMPSVTELCIDAASANGVCPANPGPPVACRIDDIKIRGIE